MVRLAPADRRAAQRADFAAARGGIPCARRFPEREQLTASCMTTERDGSGPNGRRAGFSGSCTRCLVPSFDGASLSHDSKEALWDKFYTAAPPRRRQSVEQYKIVKRA